MGEAVKDNLSQQIRRDFSYHAATEVTGPAHTSIRRVLDETTYHVFLLCGINPLETASVPSRELSMFKTKMEEAMMWANAHVARNMSRDHQTNDKEGE